MSKRLIPKFYRDTWPKAKDDPKLFTKVFISPDPELIYTPTDDQLEFMERARSGLYDELWMAGGNSEGKSWTGKFLGTYFAAYKIKPNKEFKN